MVLNRILRQQRLILLASLALHTALQRRSNQVVEQERAVHQQRKARDLQPLERLPAEAQRHHPDEQRAAGVDCRARRSGHSARDGEAEEVEATSES